MIVPLAILNHLRPTRHLPPALQIQELFPPDTRESELMPQPHRPWFRWRNLFLHADRLLKQIDRLGLKPFRGRALREAVRWSDEQAGSHLPPAAPDGVGERDYAFSD